MKMFRILAISAGVVNLLCMYLAQITGDLRVFLIAWAGASFSFYGYLYFSDEAQERGQTRMGYQNLAMRLRYDISQDALQPGMRLPTTSELARRHNTTRTTVMRALHILADERIIDLVHGRGIYVAGAAPRTDRPKDRIETHIMKHQPGQVIPPVEMLAAEHGASGATVRRVQAQLVARGAIRRAASGTYIRA